MNKYLAVLIFCSALAFGQTKVDQGRPGTQGPWPVSLVGGGISFPDGGIGVIQESFPWLIASADGGTIGGPEDLLDTGNSTTTPLGPSGTFTGTARSTLGYSYILGSAISDKASSNGGMCVEFSQNGTNWDWSECHTLIANQPAVEAIPVSGRYYRFRFTNGAVGQTYFRLQAILKVRPASGTVSPVGDIPSGPLDGTLAQTTHSLIFGETASGLYRDVKVTPSGALTVETSQASFPWLVAGADGGAVRSQLVPATYPADGGLPTNGSPVQIGPYPCGAATKQDVFTMDGGAVTIGSLNPRVYVVVCNSRESTGTGNVRCRSDGTAPVLDAGTPGILLAVGECVPLSNAGGQPVKCIASGDYFVTSYECAP